MNTSYLIIQPKYSDPDTFCEIIVGNRSCRAAVQMYPDERQLASAAEALLSPDEEFLPEPYSEKEDDIWLWVEFAVLRLKNRKIFRVKVYNEEENFSACIKILLTQEESAELGTELKAWLANPAYQFVWKN